MKVDKRGRKTGRFLTGAIRSFTSINPDERNIIFNMKYRISGSPKNIASALRYKNISEREINVVLKTSITRNNYFDTTTKQYSSQFLREIDFVEKLKLFPYQLDVPDYNFNNFLRIIRMEEFKLIIYFINVYNFDLTNYNYIAYRVAHYTNNEILIDMIGDIIVEHGGTINILKEIDSIKLIY